MYGGTNSGHGPVAMTLYQFTTAIGDALRMSPVARGAWVVAELSDVRVSGGHCYMELVEKNAQGQTVAKLRATIWQSSFRYVRDKFLAATGREIMTGMKVMLYGAAVHHNLYGLSFTVGDIDPSYTLGDMERLRREILQRLHAEGVIWNNRGLTMPPAPQRIAVISAEGAAGYGDFINHLCGNAEGFVFYPCLIPAVMQGEKTSSSVRSALDFVRRTSSCWDCVAIVRGGGATTDLNGFDDYELARAVATFPLPVVVGIGHERDRTVLDEIAHTREKTPTAVAAFFVDSLRVAYERAAVSVDAIIRQCNDKISGESRRLANVEALVPALAQATLTRALAEVDREMSRLPVIVQSRLSRENVRLDSFGHVLTVMSRQKCLRAEERLGMTSGMVASAAESVLMRSTEKLRRLEDMVAVLSPSGTMRRGYSITRVNGKAVTDASQLSSGTVISTVLLNGEVESVIV